MWTNCLENYTRAPKMNIVGKHRKTVLKQVLHLVIDVARSDETMWIPRISNKNMTPSLRKNKGSQS